MKTRKSLGRICFDTNVVLDVLLERAPFVEPAARLLDAVSRRSIEGLLCATTLTTVDFLLVRHRNREIARQGLAWLLSIFDVAPVNRTVFDQALKIDWSDFEDAVLHEASYLADATAIVTRNTKDFNEALLHVYTPEECLAILETE